jgi:diadenosine tetraphosphatase ApaH/serine/threonine PP2A family protein phosphatase
MLLVGDNLAGHQTAELMIGLCEQGILPLYTPLSGSWLNMAESMQRILVRRALDGQNPETPQQIIHRLETVAQVWNQQPTPFQWGGEAGRATATCQIATTATSLGRFRGLYPVGLALPFSLLKWRCSCQVTH